MTETEHRERIRTADRARLVAYGRIMAVAGLAWGLALFTWP